jgi:AbiU2
LGAEGTVADSDPTIPEPIASLFELLRGDLIDACARWTIFKGLYGSGPRRVALMRHTAAWFFGKLRLMLIDDVVLAIARLVDKARTHEDANQSLARLLETLDPSRDGDLLAEGRRLLAQLTVGCKPFLQHRNKRVAHRDLASRENPESMPLPGLTTAAVDAALEGIAQVMNLIQVHFTGSEMGYTAVRVPYHEDADGLVWALQKASVIDALVDPLRHWDLIQLSEFRDA